MQPFKIRITLLFNKNREKHKTNGDRLSIRRKKEHIKSAITKVKKYNKNNMSL